MNNQSETSKTSSSAADDLTKTLEIEMAKRQSLERVVARMGSALNLLTEVVQELEAEVAFLKLEAIAAQCLADAQEE